MCKTPMSKTYSQESSEAFLNFSKSALCKTKKKTKKKNSPACFNRLLWKELQRKDLVLFDVWKEKHVGTLPLLLHMDFHYKIACKNSWKTVLSQVLLTSHCKRCRNYALRFHCYTLFWLNSVQILNRVEGKLFSP